MHRNLAICAWGLRNPNFLGKLHPYTVIKCENQILHTTDVAEDCSSSFRCALETVQFKYDGQASLEFETYTHHRVRSDEMLCWTALQPEQFFDHGFLGELVMEDETSEPGQEPRLSIRIEVY